MSSDLICAAERLFPDAEHFIPVRGDKRPLCPGWNDSGYSATDLEQFNTNPNFRAVGVNLARARGLLCIDIDDASGWALIKQHGLDLPDTLQIGRTGDPLRVKLFYSLTDQQSVDLQQHNLGGKTKRPGIDLFWASGQVVVAGRHPAGAYHDNDHPIAALPDGWIQWLTAHEAGAVQLAQMLTGQNAERLRSGFQVGSRNHQLFAFAADAFAAQSELQRRGVALSGPDADTLIQQALARTDQTDFDPVEIADTIASARAGRSPSIGFEKRLDYATGNRQPQQTHQTQQPQPVADYGLFSGLPWGMNDDGERQKPTKSNAHIALIHFKALGCLWFDELKQAEMIGTEPLTDHHLTLAEAAYAANGWALGYEPICRAVIGAARSNPRNTIREYLDGLSGPADDDVWGSLDRYMLGIDDDMARYYLPRFLVGAVARAYNPGAAVRHVPVLVGGQEIGKTTIAEYLFGGPRYFASINLEGQSKDSLATCHQHWCIELSELDGITKRRDCESLKTFISTNVDTYRPPFGRLNVVKPRGFVFWATSNSAPLNDPTGSTRFVAIRVGSELLPLDWIKEHRDELWARAVAEYRAGFDWERFDDLHRALQATRNSQEQVEDDWTDLIADRVLAHGDGPIPKQMVYAWLEVPKERQNNMTARRIRMIMEGLGRRSARQFGRPRSWVVDVPATPWQAEGGASTQGGVEGGMGEPSDSSDSQDHSTHTTHLSIGGVLDGTHTGGQGTQVLYGKTGDMGDMGGIVGPEPRPPLDLAMPPAHATPLEQLDHATQTLVRQLHAEDISRTPDTLAHLLVDIGGPALDPGVIAQIIR